MFWMVFDFLYLMCMYMKWCFVIVFSQTIKIEFDINKSNGTDCCKFTNLVDGPGLLNSLNELSERSRFSLSEEGSMNIISYHHKCQSIQTYWDNINKRPGESWNILWENFFLSAWAITAAGSSIEGSCCLCTLGRRGVPPGDLHRHIDNDNYIKEFFSLLFHV